MQPIPAYWDLFRTPSLPPLPIQCSMFDVPCSNSILPLLPLRLCCLCCLLFKLKTTQINPPLQKCKPNTGRCRPKNESSPFSLLLGIWSFSEVWMFHPPPLPGYAKLCQLPLPPPPVDEWSSVGRSSSVKQLSGKNCACFAPCLFASVAIHKPYWPKAGRLDG